MLLGALVAPAGCAGEDDARSLDLETRVVQGRMIWSDEFNGPKGALPGDQWRILTGGGGWGNGELQTYKARKANVSLNGKGQLRIVARKSKKRKYTSARIESVPAVTHGVIKARIKVPKGKGIWSAFWTLGEDHENRGWPKVGEIDIMELLNDTETLNANVHVADRASADGRWQRPGNVRNKRGFAGEWHVYAVRWTSKKLVFKVDGTTYHTVTRAELERDGRSWPFDSPRWCSSTWRSVVTGPERPTARRSSRRGCSSTGCGCAGFSDLARAPVLRCQASQGALRTNGVPLHQRPSPSCRPAGLTATTTAMSA